MRNIPDDWHYSASPQSINSNSGLQKPSKGIVWGKTKIVTSTNDS